MTGTAWPMLGYMGNSGGLGKTKPAYEECCWLLETLESRALSTRP